MPTPTCIEQIWSKVWWGLHYGGRGGPSVLALSALDIALWDLKARRARLPLWKLLGGNDPNVPCYAGGIDLDFTFEALLEQTDGNLKKGFRAIKMKVGRERLSEDVARIAAMRKHLGDGFPLMVDANMKWTWTSPSSAPRLPAASISSGWRSRPFPTTWPGTPASCARAACRSPPARTCARCGSSST